MVNNDELTCLSTDGESKKKKKKVVKVTSQDPGSDPDLVSTGQLPDQVLKAVGVKPGTKYEGSVQTLLEGKEDIDIAGVELTKDQVNLNCVYLPLSGSLLVKIPVQREEVRVSEAWLDHQTAVVSPELFYFWKSFDREPKQAITQPRESAAEEILFEESRLKEFVHRLRGRTTLHLFKIDFFISKWVKETKVENPAQFSWRTSEIPKYDL